MDEPRRRERVGADLLPGCLRGLEGGGDDDESSVVGVEYVARGGERRGLAGAGGTFDDEQTSLAGQGGDDLPLGDVEVVGPVDAGGVLDRSHRTRGEAVDQLCLDGEDAVGGEVPDVVGYVGAFAQCSALAQRTRGEVLGELDACGSTDDDPDGRDQLLRFSSDVGGVPRGALRSQAREHQIDGDVSSEPADGGRVELSRLGRRSEPEIEQLVVPTRHQLGTVGRHDLVGTRVGPRAPVPGTSQLRPRFFTGMVRSPFGLVAVDVAGDLRGALAEPSGVRRELLDLASSRRACTRARPEPRGTRGRTMTAA